VQNASEPALKRSATSAGRLSILLLALLTFLAASLIALATTLAASVSATPTLHAPTRVATVSESTLPAGPHGFVLIRSDKRAELFEAHAIHVCDLAIQAAPRLSTVASALPTAPLGTSTTHSRSPRPRAPPIRPFLAAEGGDAGGALVKFEPYPSNGGFLGQPVEDTLQPGTRISRFGGAGGTYASPEDVPFSERGLPPSAANSPYTVYEVVKPVDVQGGIAQYWMGGGGISATAMTAGGKSGSPAGCPGRARADPRPRVGTRPRNWSP
jgi:hypothetical protein